jgi:PadR family transcriptional regulator, regulatory protein PadR
MSNRSASQLLRAMLADPGREMYGLELIEATGLRGGTLYPLVAWLERAGWLESEWEPRAAEGHPRRRYYRLTRDGAARAERTLRRPALRLGVSHG